MAKTALADLPDDVRQLIQPHIAESPDVLAAIGVVIAKKRDEAKSARTSSGIETVWKECEEAYTGIDDANRHEFQNARWAKPMSVDGPVTTGRMPQRGTEHKSTIFIKLTSRYVDAGSAKLAEILLPEDDKAFTFSEMPIPELIKAKEDRSQVFHEGLRAPLTRPLAQGEPVPVGAANPTPPAPVAAPAAGIPPAAAGAPGIMPPGAAPAVPGAAQTPPIPPRVPLTVADFAQEQIELERKKAKAAEKRIYDWMIGSQYTAEMRKVIKDAARIGVGVLKAPVPESRRNIAVEKGDGDEIQVIIKEKIYPCTRWVDPWNIFPDPACGENIHHGDFLFERDYMSERQIRALKNLPGYVSSQIDAAIKEGPDTFGKDSDSGAGGSDGDKKRKGRYEVWYYFGTIERDELIAIWQAAGNDASAPDPAQSQIFAIVTMINDRPVRATINPLDSGSFPYHSFPWSRRDGHWAGIGVAEQIRAPQKALNGATRAMMNNAGKSAGSQIVVNQQAIKPADGEWTMTPDKIWYMSGDMMSGANAAVDDAFHVYDIPNMTDQLLKIIDKAEQWAEETSSIPLITQGQSGDTQPDTLGGMNLQNNNANQLLRSIGYSVDDFITEPVVRQYYEWLLLDPDVPDYEKGEFTINAHGSIAMVERAIQDQTIAQMGNMVVNPAYGLNPKKWAKLFLKSKRIDPEAVAYTAEEQAKIDAAPPPDPPAVAVAKVNADTQLKLGVMKQSAEAQSAQSEERIAAAANALEGGHVQNEAARVAAEERRTQADAAVRLHEIQLTHQRALLEYATKRGISLQAAKTDLAKTAMSLQTQRDLNAADNAADIRKSRERPERPQRSTPALVKPPDQVPGRAGNGRAFEQGNA